MKRNDKLATVTVEYRNGADFRTVALFAMNPEQFDNAWTRLMESLPEETLPYVRMDDRSAAVLGARWVGDAWQIGDSYYFSS